MVTTGSLAIPHQILAMPPGVAFSPRWTVLPSVRRSTSSHPREDSMTTVAPDVVDLYIRHSKDGINIAVRHQKREYHVTTFGPH